MAGVVEKKEKHPDAPGNIVSKIDLEFEYLIVCCGYTGRLVRHYLDLGAEFLVNCEKNLVKQRITLAYAKKKQNKGTLYQYAYESEPNYCDEPPIPLLISDNLHGCGGYVLTKDPTSANTEKMLAEEAQILKECDITSRAFIAFRCADLSDAFQIVGNLIELRHCGCFGITPYKMSLVTHKTGKRVLIMTFDTESG